MAHQTLEDEAREAENMIDTALRNQAEADSLRLAHWSHGFSRAVISVYMVRAALGAARIAALQRMADQIREATLLRLAERRACKVRELTYD